MRNNKGLLVFPIVASFFVGAIGTYLVFDDGLVTKNVVETVNKVTITEESIAEAVDKIEKAAVLVRAYKSGSVISTGTGFVYKASGNIAYIMTNNHVISGSDDVEVMYSDLSIAKAKIIGNETYSDIAVLSVDKSSILTIATLGDSSKLRVGDTLFTVGSPLGSKYFNTVTKGILSGKDRLVEVSLSGGITDYIMKVLQTDAAINPGNSGGPLVNINGEVIGINSLKLVQDEIEGMGFAIPIEDALYYTEKLENGEKIERPFVGIEMLDLTDRNLYNISVPDNVSAGVYIKAVSDNSPASKANFKEGDIIVKIGDNPTRSIAEFRYELYKHKPGDIIKITYYRENKEYTVNVTLAKNNS